jgi:hypothetical protein
MEQACGWLRWPPAVFWNATLAEVAIASSGYVESRTGQSPRARLERLAAMYAEVQEAQEKGGG